MIFIFVLLFYVTNGIGQDLITKKENKQQKHDMPLDYFFSSYNHSFQDENQVERKKKSSIPIWTIGASAIIPGLGQALQKKWLRASLYASVEAGLWFVYFNQRSRAKNNQENYNRYVQQNWSVVKYSQWLIQYYENNSLIHENINNLKDAVNNVTPRYDTQDWEVVNIDLLRSIEQETPFIFEDGSLGNPFSHTLPIYDTQQYYELVSKYFQFGAGWRDYDNQVTNRPWDGTDISPLFQEGSRKAKKFNDQYRTAQLMLGFLLVNRIVSVVDAIITVKLSQNRHIKTSISTTSTQQINIKLWF